MTDPLPLRPDIAAILPPGPHPAPSMPPLCDGGPAVWHALTVTPQHEDQAEGWLSRRGVYGFHPVLRRRVRVMGRWRDYDRRFLPGYVFARFSGRALPHRVTACPWITGAITTSGGVWGVLDPARLRAIHAMRKVAADLQAQAGAAAQAAAVRQRRAAQVHVGDGALFTAGPFSGVGCEVVDLDACGGARVRLVLLGRESVLQVTAADLVPLRRAG